MNKIRKIVLLTIGVILMLFCFQSCFKDVDFKDLKDGGVKVNINPEFAFPLINANIGIGTTGMLENMASDTNSRSKFFIDYDNEGMMRMNYHVELNVNVPEIAVGDFVPYGLVSSVQDSLFMDFFKNFKGAFGLKGAHLKLTAINTSENDFYVTKNALRVGNDAGQVKDLATNIDSVIILAGTANAPRTTVLVEDNLAGAINISPYYLYYDLFLKSGAGSVKEGDIQFKAEIVFDVHGYFRDLVLDDTLDFSIGSSNDSISTKINNIKVEMRKLTLGVVLTNNFPLSGDVQIYFMDDNYQIIDSLFAEGHELLKPALQDPISFKILKNESVAKSIEVDHARYALLEKASHVYLKTRFSSYNAPTQNIKIFKSNYFNVKMKFKSLGNIQTESK